MTSRDLPNHESSRAPDQLTPNGPDKYVLIVNSLGEGLHACATVDVAAIAQVINSLFPEANDLSLEDTRIDLENNAECGIRYRDTQTRRWAVAFRSDNALDMDELAFALSVSRKEIEQCLEHLPDPVARITD